MKLAHASAHFQQGDNDLTAQAWTWLEDNDLGGIGSNADVRYDMTSDVTRMQSTNKKLILRWGLFVDVQCCSLVYGV